MLLANPMRRLHIRQRIRRAQMRCCGCGRCGGFFTDGWREWMLSGGLPAQAPTPAPERLGHHSAAMSSELLSHPEIALTSKNSSIPQTPPSRARPDALTPPKGDPAARDLPFNLTFLGEFPSSIRRAKNEGWVKPAASPIQGLGGGRQLLVFEKYNL